MTVSSEHECAEHTLGITDVSKWLQLYVCYCYCELIGVTLGFLLLGYTLVSPGTFLFLGSHIITGDQFSFKHTILSASFRVMCDFIAS